MANEIGKWAITIILILGIIGICYVIAQAVGIAIPPWIITILWIILAVVIGVCAIKFLLSLWGGPGGPPCDNK